MNEATYCPEDNKLRLYVGRVPRDEYEKLRADGWTSTPKQACDFVATWTPRREDTALEYSGGILGDEDQSPQDRAADRAERFGGYLEKRESEALQIADRYDSGPAVHGYQSQALAERRAARHDLQATRACNQWEKAEYWQRRTAGVIRNALHKSAPGVRMGRIKTLESEQRKAQKAVDDYKKRWEQWRKVRDITDPEKQHAAAVHMAQYYSHGSHYKHPRPESGTEYGNEHGTSLLTLLTQENDPITGAEACELWFKGMVDPAGPEWENSSIARWLRHYDLRLAYENQMLEAQGGRLASVDIEPGGFIGEKQIQKVNKSPKTGRVVSVQVKTERVSGWAYMVKNVPGTDYALLTIKTERLKPGVYRPPTDEERQEFKAWQKEDKKARAAKNPKTPPMLNLTLEDAERLQAIWNEYYKRGLTNGDRQVKEMTQKEYSSYKKGAYGRANTIQIIAGGTPARASFMNKDQQSIIARIRSFSRSVVVLTDKPQKPAPKEVWKKPEQERATA